MVKKPDETPPVDTLSTDGPFTRPEDDSFERQLERLEEIVNELEHDALGLSDALARYEEGMRLARACLARLEEAELRIQTLSLE